MKLDRIDGPLQQIQHTGTHQGSREGNGFSWWGTEVGGKRSPVHLVLWLPPDNQLLCHCLQKVQTVNSPVGMSVVTSDWALTQSEQ